jgi:hypothetical protein
MDIECCWIDGYFQLFQVELADCLIADIPGIEEKFTTFVLPILNQRYFHILNVLSVLPLNIVSLFLE